MEHIKARIKDVPINAISNESQDGYDKASYENYLKMEREKAHFESTIAEKRKKDIEFGKMVKKARVLNNLQLLNKSI